MNIDIENFVDVKQSLEIIDLEGSQSKEGLKIDDVDIEDFAALLEEIPNELAYLWQKSSLLKRRQGNQGISDQIVQTKLNERKVVMNEKYGEEFVRSVGIIRKQGKAFVFIELINSDEDLYAGRRKCEVNLNLDVNSEDQIEVKKNEIIMSQKDGMLLNL